MIIASSGSGQETCSNKPRHLRPVRCGDKNTTWLTRKSLSARESWREIRRYPRLCDMSGGKVIWSLKDAIMDWSLVQGKIIRSRTFIAFYRRWSMKMCRVQRMMWCDLWHSRQGRSQEESETDIIWTVRGAMRIRDLMLRELARGMRELAECFRFWQKAIRLEICHVAVISPVKTNQ